MCTVTRVCTWRWVIMFCTTLSSTLETYILVLEPKSWLRLTLTSFGIADVCVRIVASIKNGKKKFMLTDIF